MMVNNLQQVVLTIFENHEDAFILENDFGQVNDIGMGQLGAQGHLSDG